MKIFHIIVLFTEKTENAFIIIVKRIPFNGSIKSSPYGQRLAGGRGLAIEYLDDEDTDANCVVIKDNTILNVIFSKPLRTVS